MLLERPIVSPVVVGRAAHVASLERALQEAAAGGGQVMLLAGEAGIGKSRLIAEASARADRLGFLRLEGCCFEPDRSLPFAPLLDLLRARLTGLTGDALAEELGPCAPELVTLLPELAARLPGLLAAPPLDAEAEKRRIFRAIADLLTRLAATRPTLIVLEDLHWSDDTSLECLLELVRHVAARPMLLLASYRTDEAHASLRRFLAELDRRRLAAELALPRLTMAEADAMIRAIFGLGRPVRAEFLEAIWSLTEGNPFFMEEVLRSLVAAGDIFHADAGWDRKPIGDLRIPRSVRDAVQRRLTQVSARAGRALTIAAVAGRRVDFTLLEALTGLSEAELLAAVEELVAAQLLIEESAEHFAFRHALTREAVYGHVLVRERRALHRAIGEALERRDAGGGLEAPVADLARHFAEAEVWEKALLYARDAGERAQALDTPRAVVEQFGRALHAASRLRTRPPVSVLRGRARAYETLGEFESARTDYERAREIARNTGEERAEWQGLIDLGFLWLARDHEQAGRFFQDALDLARRLGDPAVVAHSLNRAGNWHVTLDRPLGARAHHEEALAIFERLGDKAAVASTLDLLGMASVVGSDTVSAAAHYERAIALFRELGDRRGLASSLATLTVTYRPTFLSETIVPHPCPPVGPPPAEEAVALSRAIGWRAGEAFALVNLGACLGADGEYGRALGCAGAALDIADDIGHGPWRTASHLLLGVLHLDLLALPAARRHLTSGLALARTIGSRLWSRLLAASLASAHLLAGDPAAAEDVLAGATDDETADFVEGQRVVTCARAQARLAGGEPEAALGIADRLIATAPNLAQGVVIPRLWALRGEALAALGRAGEAEAALSGARDAVAARGPRSTLWRIDVARGRLLLAQGRRGEAASALAAADREVDRLAATIPDEAAREAFRRAARATMPSPPPGAGTRTAEARLFGLTVRELEVARLLAERKSNREIAGTLFVSERTVETHVSHILSKLGLASRAEVAAWAAAHGLTRKAP